MSHKSGRLRKGLTILGCIDGNICRSFYGGYETHETHIPRVTHAVRCCHKFPATRQGVVNKSNNIGLKPLLCWVARVARVARVAWVAQVARVARVIWGGKEPQVVQNTSLSVAFQIPAKLGDRLLRVVELLSADVQ